MKAFLDLTCVTVGLEGVGVFVGAFFMNHGISFLNESVVLLWTTGSLSLSVISFLQLLLFLYLCPFLYRHTLSVCVCVTVSVRVSVCVCPYLTLLV